MSRPFFDKSIYELEAAFEKRVNDKNGIADGERGILRCIISVYVLQIYALSI